MKIKIIIFYFIIFSIFLTPIIYAASDYENQQFLRRAVYEGGLEKVKKFILDGTDPTTVRFF